MFGPAAEARSAVSRRDPPGLSILAPLNCERNQAQRYNRNLIFRYGNRSVTRSMHLPLGSKENGERWHGSRLERCRVARAAGQGVRRHSYEVDDCLDTHRPDSLLHPAFTPGTISSGLIVTSVPARGCCASSGNRDPVVQRFDLRSYNEFDLRRSWRMEVQDQALGLAKLAAAEQQQVVEGIHQVLIALSELPAVKAKDPQACSAYLLAIQRRYPAFLGFIVVDINGQSFCTTTGKSVSVAGRADFVYATTTGEFAVGGYSIGLLTGRKVVPFTVPFYDDDGHMAGVIMTAISLEWLAKSIAQTEVPRVQRSPSRTATEPISPATPTMTGSSAGRCPAINICTSTIRVPRSRGSI